MRGAVTSRRTTTLLEAPGVVCDAYTGLLRASSEVPRRPHDPDVFVWAVLFAGAEGDAAGGAGLTLEAARMAAVGEAIERVLCAASPADQVLTASLDELRGQGSARALDPSSMPLFTGEQHASPGFPFAPFDPARPMRWVGFRELTTGEPVWGPEELAFLRPGPAGHGLAPSISTGLAAGPVEGVVLRGLQEVIERDAIMGAWWGSYAIDQLDAREVFAWLGASVARRLQRPNLRYRFYRVRSPFSDHVTIASLEGDDREGPVVSFGSACRETIGESLLKAAIEAVQGRGYVRMLLAAPAPVSARPRSFAEHAAHHARHPGELARTPLASAAPASLGTSRGPESLTTLLRKLGPDHAPLVRLVTPARVARHAPGWVVVRVVAPGLTPLHGDHALAHLASPLWRGRPLSAWAAHPPHPFP